MTSRGTYLVGGACAMALVLFVTSTTAVPGESQLAQILKVETVLLKQWQQTGALRKNLAEGATGEEVKLLQRMLAQDPLLLSSQHITGTYGPRTTAAVKKFQADYDLTETGNVDAPTRAKLNEIF